MLMHRKYSRKTPSTYSSRALANLVRIPRYVSHSQTAGRINPVSMTKAAKPLEIFCTLCFSRISAFRSEKTPCPAMGDSSPISKPLKVSFHRV